MVSDIGWISITTIYPKIYDRLLRITIKYTHDPHFTILGCNLIYLTLYHCIIYIVYMFYKKRKLKNNKNELLECIQK